MKPPKVIVVLPAYNAEKTLVQTVKEIPLKIVDQIILVDDGSQDQTVKVAKKLNLRVYRHTKNLGYGANQKTCYNLALKAGADIVVMLHPDYQYDPRLIRYFVDFIKEGYFDVMLGSRIRNRREALDGGMPRYKYFANRFLTLLENICTGQNLTDWHTGMRAFTRRVLEDLDYTSFSNDFVFDSQALIKIAKKGFRIGEIPAPVRYFRDASSINFKRSLKYGLQTVYYALKSLIM